MDELESQSVPDAEAGDSDVTAPSAAAATTATTMIVESSSAESPSRIPSGDFVVITETPCDAGSPPASSCTAPLSWRPPAAAAAATTTAAGSRPSETREVHHVTFAEPCNKYVHSDSGIVLSPDDSDLNDAAVDGQSAELTDDECDEVTGDQATDSPVRCPAATNAVPGPPIIKLHRCRSNESQDNPFLSDGELRRKADYIIAHSTILRTYVCIADPDQMFIDLQSTSDTELHPGTANDPSEAQAPQLASGLTVGEVHEVSSPENSTETHQKVAVSKEVSAPVRNGEAEEPLLARKKEGNGLETSPNKHTRSKKRKCCVVQ